MSGNSVSSESSSRRKRKANRINRIFGIMNARTDIGSASALDLVSTWKRRRGLADPLRSGGFPDVRFRGFDLARGRAEENADGERDDATDEDKPRPRNLGPPLGHEPTEVPFSSHQFSPEERENIEGRNRNLA